MASFHFEIKSGSKGTAKKHADYITRQGFYQRREDLVFAGHGNLPAWAEHDPSLFWQAADKYERINAAAYRELVAALPIELSNEQVREMVDVLVFNLIGAKPYQYAVHAVASSLQGEINLHIHLMYSDRLPDDIERPPEQLFSRYNPKEPGRGGRRKDSGGKTRMELRDDVLAKRKAVADIQNAHLRANGHAARVDHRSLVERGSDRKPEHHLGAARVRKMSAKNKAEYLAARAARPAPKDEQ